MMHFLTHNTLSSLLVITVSCIFCR